MATLTYWYSKCLDDADAYSIIAKTKREALALRDQYGHDRFGSVVKRTLYYKDAFDLFDYATGEGGGRNTGEGEWSE